jgi:hypothetical protein
MNLFVDITFVFLANEASVKNQFIDGVLGLSQCFVESVEVGDSECIAVHEDIS